MTAPAPRPLASAGSLREASYNPRLIPVLAEGARIAGARAGLVELRGVLADERLRAGVQGAAVVRAAAVSSARGAA